MTSQFFRNFSAIFRTFSAIFRNWIRPPQTAIPPPPCLRVYVASLLHGVRECEGGRDVCAPHAVHRGHAQHCGWKPLPDRVKRYVLGMVAPAEKPTGSIRIRFGPQKS